MRLHVRAVLDAFRDTVGRVMIIVGFLLLIYAIASFSMAYQWESSASLILGVFLATVGVFLHFETYQWSSAMVFVLGVFLIIVGLFLNFETYPLWVSAISFALGLFSMIVGLFLHFEIFNLRVPSREGWGAILICASAIFLASAVSATFFTVAGREHLFRVGRREITWLTLLELQRPGA